MADMSRLLKSKHVEDGFAIALKYLQEEFHDCQVDVIDPDGPEGDPDRDIRQAGHLAVPWFIVQTHNVFSLILSF